MSSSRAKSIDFFSSGLAFCKTIYTPFEKVTARRAGKILAHERSECAGRILDFGGPKMRVPLVKSALPALWSSEEEKSDRLGGLCQFPLFTPGASGVKIGNLQKPS